MSDEKENYEVLRPLKGKPKPRTIATIDIETRQWIHPYAVGFYDGQEYRDFIGEDCIAKAMLHVLQPKYVGYWIYAHNGGNFDFTFFLRRLLSREMERRFKTEITPIGSCMFRIDVFELDKDGDKKATSKHKRVKWTFIDSARLMPIRLNDLGETFGIGKKVELAMSYDELAMPKNRALMQSYLKQDCVLLYKAVNKIQDTINKLGGQIGPTLPSTSLDLFRRRFLREYIYTNRHFIGCEDHGKKPTESKCPGCGHEFIRKAYYGGRAEIFRMKFIGKNYKLGEDPEVDKMWEYTPGEYVPGHEEAYLYDVNSMYPACMLEAMPIGPGVVAEGPHVTEDFVYKNAKLKTGIVECDVYIPEDCYLPPLPIKKKGGKLIFPVGRFSGTWDTAELTLLKEVGGRIEKVHKSVWFDEATIFTGFVKSIYKYRDKSIPTWNKGMDWIAKILLNAAYGKFAMKEERNRFVVHPDDIEGLTPIDFTADIWSEDVRVTPSYIVPQLAVHITALARRQLWTILNGVLRAGGRIYYCDTDSVVCSGVKLPTGKQLGALKLENVIDRAEFVLPKLYLIETREESKKKKREPFLKVKAKGMGPGIRVGDNLGDDDLDGQLSEREFFDMVRNGTPIQRHRLTKFREALSDFLKKKLDFPRVISSPKTIQSSYDKRLVLDDYDTAPIRM